MFVMSSVAVRTDLCDPIDYWLERAGLTLCNGCAASLDAHHYWSQLSGLVYNRVVVVDHCGAAKVRFPTVGTAAASLKSDSGTCFERGKALPPSQAFRSWLWIL